jgi:ribosomal protein L13E
MQTAKPIVRNRYIVRTGRGYSYEELRSAGIDPRLAKRRGLPVDVWRQSKHPENVEQLKSAFKTIESRKPPKKEKKVMKKD